MSGQRGQISHGSKAPIDLDQIWSDLLQGILQVYNKQAMSKERYIDLYTYFIVFNLFQFMLTKKKLFSRHVYNYCTNVNNQNVRGNVSIAPNSSKAKKSQTAGGAQFVGHELYKRLQDFLKNHLSKVLEVQI